LLDKVVDEVWIPEDFCCPFLLLTKVAVGVELLGYPLLPG